MLAMPDRGDTVLVPTPAYPIHVYPVIFAGGQVRTLPLPGRGDGNVDGEAPLAAVQEAVDSEMPRSRALMLSFPNNPTPLTADRRFFERVVELCDREQLLLVHGFAYADFGFDDEPPTLLQIPGAKEFGVEFFSMSNSYCMAGRRVGGVPGRG